MLWQRYEVCRLQQHGLLLISHNFSDRRMGSKLTPNKSFDWRGGGSKREGVNSSRLLIPNINFPDPYKIKF